ncbi:MAG: hypothetical protein AAGA54_10425 [Myxococcota bacterium]
MPVSARTLAALLAMTAASACTFDAADSGGLAPGGVAPTDDTTTAGETSGGSSSGNVSTSTGIDAASSSSTSAAESSSSTSGIEDGPAVLQWRLNTPAIDFGAIPLEMGATSVVRLENVGGRTATSIDAQPIPGAFSFPGGFPGNDGDCSTDLAAGASCKVQVRFGPQAVGVVQSSVDVVYYDGVDLSAPTEAEPLVLIGGGRGESENLLVNGGAESGLVDPWSAQIFSGLWGVVEDAYAGTYAFAPAGVVPQTTTMTQSPSLDDYAEQLSSPGIRYRLRGRARTNDAEHSYSISIGFDAASETIVDGNASGWTPLYVEGVIPLGATDVTLQLECNKAELLGSCEARFDNLELHLLYP